MEEPGNSADDASSDYGPDFTLEEELLLVDLLESKTRLPLLPFTGAANLDDGLDRQSHTSPDVPDRKKPIAISYTPSPPPQNLEDSQTERHRFQEEKVHGGDQDSRRSLGEQPNDSSTADLSPLERFRSKPKKPLSVTDLISPTWCELQYWYSLTKYGRKRRTAAMKQGTKVHQGLEDEIYTSVTISVHSREDKFALRLLNAIQGLRALRFNGMTRELEVWGIVDGEVVNGIIDEVSHTCPDNDLEKSSSVSKEGTSTAGQLTLEETLNSQRQGHGNLGGIRSLSSMRRKTSKVYLSDTKTRGHKSIPKGASFRPTLYQLMLYHLLVSGLFRDKVDFVKIAARYDLDLDLPLSDEFIDQVDHLGSPRESLEERDSQTKSSDSGKEEAGFLHKGTRLQDLWQIMMREWSLALPRGTQSLGKVLKAEYRDRADNTIIGMKTFLYDEEFLQDYVQSEMSWWKGQRKAAGVSIEEAYKCKSCDFQDTCEWRLSKVKDATEKHRARTTSIV